jgi:hypothetical protein
MTAFNKAWDSLKDRPDEPGETTAPPNWDGILSNPMDYEYGSAEDNEEIPNDGESPTQESSMVGSEEPSLEQQLERLQQIIEQKESLIQELRERQKKLSVAGRFQ